MILWIRVLYEDMKIALVLFSTLSTTMYDGIVQLSAFVEFVVLT